MQRFIRRIAGNRRALARLVVILTLLLAAVALAVLSGADSKALVGSCVGAALSLSVGSLVAILEDDKLDSIPAAFLAAAKKDVEQAAYYRENQKIRVRSTKSGIGEEFIELQFTALLVPLNGSAKIDHPKVDPPLGTSLARIEYRVDGAALPKDQDRLITRRTKDELSVVYRVDDGCPQVIEDRHRWPSPVLDYAVEYEPYDGHVFQVGKIVAGANTIALQKRRRLKSKYDEFVGDGPAFSTQGLRWKITRG